MLTADAQKSLQRTQFWHWLNQVVLWALIIQALWATYTSLNIIFIQLPANESSVDLVVGDAVLSVFSAAISVILASWFNRSRSQNAQYWQTALGFLAVLVNFGLSWYLANQSSLVIVEAIADFF